MWIAPKLEVSDELDAEGKAVISITHGRFTVSTPVSETEAAKMAEQFIKMFAPEMDAEDAPFLHCGCNGLPTSFGCGDFYKGMCARGGGLCEHQMAGIADISDSLPDWFCSTYGEPAIKDCEHFDGPCGCRKTDHCKYQVPF